MPYAPRGSRMFPRVWSARPSAGIVTSGAATLTPRSSEKAPEASKTGQLLVMPKWGPALVAGY